jgi:hypothetical protein
LPASERVTRTNADSVTCAGCRSTRAKQALASSTISSSPNDPKSSSVRGFLDCYHATERP